MLHGGWNLPEFIGPRGKGEREQGEMKEPRAASRSGPRLELEGGLSVDGPAIRGPRFLRFKPLHDMVKSLKLLLGRDGEPLLDLLDGQRNERRNNISICGVVWGVY